MLSSSVRTFTDPDEYAASLIINSAASLTVTERGKFAATHTQIHLHRVYLRHLSDALGRVNRSDYVDGRAGSGVLWPQSEGALSACGVEMSSAKMLRFGPRQGFYQRSV